MHAYTILLLPFKGFPMLILRKDVAGSNSVVFNHSWTQFTQEFGSPSSQYWIGLERLHQETTGTNCTIRFHLQSIDGTWYYAQYSNFTVGDSSSNYKLTIGGYSGNSSDAMAYHNGQPFSTYDLDNDAMPTYNFALNYGGGFWFKSCVSAGINISPARANFYWANFNSYTIVKLNIVVADLIC